MDKRPIRRKFKDNPYTLSSSEKEGLYIIDFKDIKGNFNSVKVSKEVFEVFDEAERYENSKYKEYANRIIHFDIVIENISNNTSIEDKILYNNDICILKGIIDELPDIQKRRLVKYFFGNKTLEQIAKEESCTKRAVKFSIDIALKKISINFDN